MPRKTNINQRGTKGHSRGRHKTNRSKETRRWNAVYADKVSNWDKQAA